MFYSQLAGHMDSFLYAKKQAGFSVDSYITGLRRFDEFCLLNNIQYEFNQQHCDWLLASKRSEEKQKTFVRYIATVRSFLKYAKEDNFDSILPNIPKCPVERHIPYIYSNSEISRYFNVVDSYEYSAYPGLKIIFPLMMRIFYCCGTRIHETAVLKIKDIDLKNGLISLRETKNSNSRVIPIHRELLELFRKYADKTFYRLRDDDYVFAGPISAHISDRTINSWHRKFLEYANIDYLGHYMGPRVHDFRHTFAIKSLKNLIDNGLPTHAALPLISQYLGHQNINATEYYLRLTVEHFPYIKEKIEHKFNYIFNENFKEECYDI